MLRVITWLIAAHQRSLARYLGVREPLLHERHGIESTDSKNDLVILKLVCWCGCMTGNTERPKWPVHHELIEACSHVSTNQTVCALCGVLNAHIRKHIHYKKKLKPELRRAMRSTREHQDGWFIYLDLALLFLRRRIYPNHGQGAVELD